MKTYQLILVSVLFVLLLQIGGASLRAAENKTHQINFSLTLSGHILLGIGYCYLWNEHHAVQTIFYIVPEKGLPYGITGGYNYFWGDNKWRPNLGAEFMVLASPPDPEKRKFLPMIKLVPGIRYDFNNEQNLNSRLWIAYLLKSNRVKIAPIGIEFIYGYGF